MTRQTHETLHELFGIASAGHFNQLAKCFRAGKLVDKDGKDTYITGLNQQGKLASSAANEKWNKYVDIPILMFCGESSFFIGSLPARQHRLNWYGIDTSALNKNASRADCLL